MKLLYKDLIFSYYLGTNGRDQCCINLENLFQSQRERNLFESKWQSFLDSDLANVHILSKTSNVLEYFTGSIIPTSYGQKPYLLLLFGNPAPHSVKAGAMFSAEGNSREHRIWRFLSETGVLSFENIHSSENSDITWRNKRLLSKDYKSPFQIAMTSFISFPSTASDPYWSGVAGVKKLFGSKAFNILCNSEFERLKAALKTFMLREGIIFAFQKDAFNVLRSNETPSYSRNSCLSGTLISSVKDNPNILLAAVPPTRLILSSQVKTTFIKIVKKAMKCSSVGKLYSE